MSTFTYAPNVTDEHDGEVVTFEAWTDGHALGFKVTRKSDGKASYVYLNPSQETWSDGELHPDVFVYTGPYGDPSLDTSHHFYDIDFDGEHA